MINQDEAFKGRAVIIEHDGGIPDEWAEGLARICVMRRPSDINPCRWQAVVDAAELFSDKWAVKAASFGWTTVQVFGIHRTAPTKQVDSIGLLFALADYEVTLVKLTHDQAVFEVGKDRVRQTMRRDQSGIGDARLIWTS